MAVQSPISTPIRSLFAGLENVEVLLDEALEILADEKRLKCASRELQYDYLVLACGANHSYFGHPEWETFAPGLKTIEQATEIRRRVLSAFEEAEKEADPKIKQAWLTFSVIGGGATGVELAGAIAELAKRTMQNEFRNIDPRKSKVLLIESGARLIASFDEMLSQEAKRDLETLGVEVRLNTKVQALDANSVKTDHDAIACKTAIWAAGVAPSVLGKRFQSQKPVELDKAGRVRVAADLSVPNYPNIFVIGDQAACMGKDGKPLPGLAPVAMQQGRHVAEVISARVSEQKGSERKILPFHYLDKGSMATIGRTKAVLQLGDFKLSGFVAWIAWLLIHIFYLIGFKNRVFVFLQWVWNYATYSRGARLIVDKDWRLKS